MDEHYPTRHHRLPNKTTIPRMSYIFYIGYRGPLDVPITIAKATGYHPEPDVNTLLLKTQLMYAFKGKVKLVSNKKIHCY